MLGQYLAKVLPHALRLSHTARGLALALHPSVYWGSTLERFCPWPEAVAHSQRPGVSLAFCCMLGKYLSRFCPSPEALLHGGAVPYKGSAPALRLLHTARGLALAWHSAACWGSTLGRFCPCPEAVTHSQRPGASLALCCMLGQHLRKVLPLP